MPRVAIVGGGPAGIVTARYLKAYGFEPVIFEQSGGLGGQWNASSDASGVWPGMCTNTSRVMTRFSDLRHPAGVPTYPHNREILAYLRHYATKFDIDSCVRPRTRVEHIERSQDDRYSVRFRPADSEPKTESFDYVVIATGRYNQPFIPPVPGLDSFRGHGGACHTFRYKDPAKYRGMRVLVAGCAISALEIASDLAMLGAEQVVTTYRRQRYVVPKLVAGVPADHIAFTRWSGMAGEVLPRAAMSAGLKTFILRTMGLPQHYGAQVVNDDVNVAGLALSQYFLPLVAEGRITTRPWISRIEGETVTFADNSTGSFDAIIFATGYKLSLPYLSPAIRQALAPDDERVHLDRLTFHPAVPGLAFIGMHQQIGPYFPVVELQARLIAYTWAGVVPQRSASEMQAEIAARRALSPQPAYQIMDAVALLFSRAIGTEPRIEDHPDLARALMFGPLAPTSFRITGPDALPNALELFSQDAAAFGAITSPEFTPDQQGQLAILRQAQQARTASVSAAS